MVGIGEKSGKLEVMLAKAGKTFTQEANSSISGLTSLLEPFMIIFLGMTVFVIVVAILLPATQLMSMMGPT
jgi:type II secretory pathway component PulF